jgi:hypothetical protein
VRSGHLQRRNVWFLLKVRFWPCVGYGLCSTTATFSELEQALHGQYYQILPLRGVVRSAPVGSRIIDTVFYGVGLPHVGIEALITMTNKLLMHYGCSTATGRFMQISHSLLLVELGMSFQPLQVNYKNHNHLVTHTWIKMLWEKLSMFEMTVIIPENSWGFPREGDKFIKQVLLCAGYGKEDLWRLNRVRVSLQVLFMSSVLTASGNKISSEVLFPRPCGEAWSNMQWPSQHPTASNMDLWRNAMHTIGPSRCSSTGIGQFIGQTHRVWKWYWNSNASTLHHTNDDGSSEDVFIAGRKPNCFHLSHSQKQEQHNTVCLVQPMLEGDH